MDSTSEPIDSLSSLRTKLREAEEALQRSAQSPEFLQICNELRAAAAEHKSCQKASQRPEPAIYLPGPARPLSNAAEYNRPTLAGLLKSAFSSDPATVGIRPGPSQEGPVRNTYYLAVDAFRQERKKLHVLALACARARQTLRQAEAGVTAGGAPAPIKDLICQELSPFLEVAEMDALIASN